MKIFENKIKKNTKLFKCNLNSFVFFLTGPTLPAGRDGFCKAKSVNEKFYFSSSRVATKRSSNLNKTYPHLKNKHLIKNDIIYIMKKKLQLLILVLFCVFVIPITTQAAFTEPTASPANSDQDFTQNIMGANSNNNDFVHSTSYCNTFIKSF